MDNQIERMLDNELISEIRNLSELTDGSKEKQAAVEDVTKLYKLRADADQGIIDANNALIGEQFKNEQSRKELILAKVRLGVEIGIFAAQLAFASYWARKGFEFEENGTFTSNTFRNIFQKFKFGRKN